MLMKYRILLLWNTVEMAGVDRYTHFLSLEFNDLRKSFLREKVIVGWIRRLNLMDASLV